MAPSNAASTAEAAGEALIVHGFLQGKCFKELAMEFLAVEAQKFAWRFSAWKGRLGDGLYFPKIVPHAELVFSIHPLVNHSLCAWRNGPLKQVQGDDRDP